MESCRESIYWLETYLSPPIQTLLQNSFSCGATKLPRCLLTCAADSSL